MSCFQSDGLQEVEFRSHRFFVDLQFDLQRPCKLRLQEYKRTALHDCDDALPQFLRQGRALGLRLHHRASTNASRHTFHPIYSVPRWRWKQQSSFSWPQPASAQYERYQNKGNCSIGKYCIVGTEPNQQRNHAKDQKNGGSLFFIHGSISLPYFFKVIKTSVEQTRRFVV